MNFLNRTTDLVEGFETSYGLELLATVHWVVTHEGITDREQITRAVHTWNARKQQFSSAQITLALDRLREQGWLKMAVA